MKTNLESLIKSHAEMMAEQMVKAVEWAGSEEDIRHECNKLIDEFLKKSDLNVKVRGQHEYSLGHGAIDSKYGGVIIEYKNPHGAGKITEDKNAPGVKAVVSQIMGRFRDFQAEEHIGPERIFAVGCDGDTFVFVRHRGKTIEVEDPQHVTPHSVERLLRALVSLGAKGYSFTPENLCNDFGGEGPIALDGISSIYEVILTTKSPKAQIFFKQWQILFGEVCGYDVHGQSSKIKKLGEHYRIPNAKPAELLFSVHTYYGILIKLLAAEIVSSFSPLGTSTLKKLVSAPTSVKLRSELESLEQGGIWSQLGIRNFLEGDLFSWYLDAWDERLEEAIRSMVTTLDDYDPSTLSVEPAESRDLLKKLYQHLFPKSVRHDLGEYYTPDWLAELTLNELGYDGDPDKRLLDPACGSGTFLVMTINRIKAWFAEHRHECGFGEDKLLQKILSNVIGFDLNPLAVMAARTNYLLAIRDLLQYVSEIELPVYLCDSIMTPSEYGDLFTKGYGKVSRLKTSAGEFLIPTEVASKREEIGKYADTLERCIRRDYSPNDFVRLCQAEGIPVTEEQLHKALYEQLQALDGNNQNGIWARIIKNAFAPLFIGTVNYIAGNPPWVNWENLPEDYRDSMKRLWAEYGLFTLSGSAGRLGGGKKDLSMLFAYTAVDNYLQAGGRLGFVITQSIFKTQGAGDGFRQFRYNRAGTLWHLKPLIVHDLSAMQVFEGASNRTAVFLCEKRAQRFKYPVKYVAWSGPSRIAQDEPLNSVLDATTRIKMGALPVIAEKDSSPWLTAPGKALSAIRKVIGQSDNQAYAGCCTWLNGVFWIRILDERPDGNLVIENLHDVGKIKVPRVEAVIEPDLVYPLLRGRDVSRWHALPSCHIILAQDPELRKGIPEAKMKRDLPKTYAYLKKFEGDRNNPQRGTLRGRSGYKQYFKPTAPFYSLYNVGPYTMAQWKVVWPWISIGMRCVVVSRHNGSLVVPEHNTSFAAFESADEAHYVCALLSSAPANMLICAFNAGGGGGLASPDILKFIRISAFDKTDDQHLELSRLSAKAHDSAAIGVEGRQSLGQLEREIDELAAKMWSIAPAELEAIRDALGEN